MSKIYCGNGKSRRFDNGGEVINVSLNVDELARNFKEFGWTTDGGKRMIKVKVCTNRDGVDQYGNTHYVELDTWKSDPNRQQSAPSGGTAPPPSSFESDIPFACNWC